MSQAVPDEKIQAVVGLVLQAVDQRLTTVRDQLAQLANTVNRNHADLAAQIEQCRNLASGGGGSFGHDAAASMQLVEAANMLTDRVTHLEARVNQYTNDRIAELYTAIRNAAPSLASAVPATQVPVVAPSAPVPITAPAVHVAPAASSIEELTAQMSERLAALVDRALGS